MKGFRINDWTKGVGQSPYTGFAEMRNIDLSKSGCVQPSWIGTKRTGTQITARVCKIIYGDQLYALDVAGKIWKSADGTTWTEITGHTATAIATIEYWKGYLFHVYRSSASTLAVQVYSGSGTTWSTTWWTSISSSKIDFTNIVAIVGRDDRLYFGAGNFLHSVNEKAAQNFDYTNSATYTQNTAVLDIPEDSPIIDIEELGLNLYIAAGDKIYPWDRVSSSFNLALKINEGNVNSLVVGNSLLYINAGKRCSFLVSNGSDVRLLKELPTHLFFESNNIATTVFPNASMFKDNKVFFGISSAGSYIGSYSYGVWSYHTLTGALVQENKLSATDVTATAVQTEVGALFGARSLTSTIENYYIGWRVVDATNGNSYGIDEVGASRLAKQNSAFVSWVVTPLYLVGTRNKPRTFKTISWTAGKEFGSSNSVALKISWRKNLTDSFTTIREWESSGASQTYDYNIISGYEQLQVHNTQTIQLKIELASNIELLEVVIE